MSGMSGHSENVLKIGDRGEMKLNAKSRVAYDVRRLAVASFQVALIPPDSTWSSGAVVSILFSNDGYNFVSTGLTETLSAEGMTPPIDVESVMYAAVEVTTAGSGDVSAYTHAWGE